MNPGTTSNHNRVRTVSLIVLTAFLFCPGTVNGGDATFTEYHVKALFLFNFAKYVDWPAETFPTATTPIVIGVLGQDNFKDDLQHAVEGKSINGRAIIIRRVATDAEMAGCQILFISASENAGLDEILAQTRVLPILTVGEQEQFLTKGGIINFTLKEEKVRLEINLDAARQAKVRISSKLLAVADMVKGKSN
jgi:hypothetical protein